MYLISPRMMHAFVDNLEREAVKTYTHAIHEIDHGRLPHWATMEAPSIAMDYWRLPQGSTLRDVILAIRADEACHAHVNHTFAKLGPEDDNPVQPSPCHVTPCVCFSFWGKVAHAQGHAQTNLGYPIVLAWDVLSSVGQA